MKRLIWGLVAAIVCLPLGILSGPGAQATGSRLDTGESFAPQITLLSRSYRWQWDPFRVQGDRAYAVAWITNNHQYALTLRTFCKGRGKLLRSLTGRHLIEAGKTYQWDTRQLVKEWGHDPKALVTCKFWIDGSVDLRGRIVSNLPVRMGLGGGSYSMITFNYANFRPDKG